MVAVPGSVSNPIPVFATADCGCVARPTRSPKAVARADSQCGGGAAPLRAATPRRRVPLTPDPGAAAAGCAAGPPPASSRRPRAGRRTCRSRHVRSREGGRDATRRDADHALTAPQKLRQLRQQRLPARLCPQLLASPSSSREHGGQSPPRTALVPRPEPLSLPQRAGTYAQRPLLPVRAPRITNHRPRVRAALSRARRSGPPTRALTPVRAPRCRQAAPLRPPPTEHPPAPSRRARPRRCSAATPTRPIPP